MVDGSDQLFPVVDLLLQHHEFGLGQFPILLLFLDELIGIADPFIELFLFLFKLLLLCDLTFVF